MSTSRHTMAPSQWRITRLLNWMGPYLFLAIVIVWTLTIFRTLPAPGGDHGLFVSVAERLIAGDTLYSEVYENKDPLVHYSLAISRFITPYGDWILEFFWILMSCIAAYFISCSVGISKRQSTFIGFVAAPFILEGVTYFAGSSHPPAVALVLVSVALIIRQHFVFAGFVVAVIPFYKLIAFPGVLVVTSALFLLLRIGRRNLFKFSISFLLTAFALILVVTFRQELQPYIANLKFAVEYSDNQGASGVLNKLLTHVTAVLNGANLSSFAVVVALTMLVFAVLTQEKRLASESAKRNFAVAVAAALMLFVNLGVISMTGLWTHHFQIFVPASVLAFIAFYSVFLSRSAKKPIVIGVGSFVLALTIGGVPTPQMWLNKVLYTRADSWELSRVTPNAMGLLENGESGTFARLGMGNDGGVMKGLRNWDLSCRFFAQSEFGPQVVFDETLACFPSAGFLIIDQDFVIQEGEEKWNTFVQASEDIVAANFECDSVEQGRICINKTG